jgi:ferritin-like metal-binding protein YciE
VKHPRCFYLHPAGNDAVGQVRLNTTTKEEQQMTELNARESKLVQYLNEAYGKEKELESSLTAHIGMTTRAVYKKRLRGHLTETKRHARELERRVKRLGGTPQTGPIEGWAPIAKGAGAAVGVAGRAAAAAQGPLHAIRGTGEQEKMLKNAKSEYADEHEEIATYTAIETLAQALGDSETTKLARAIRREEERMARFLEGQIPILTKAVVQAEVPSTQRPSARRRQSGKPTRTGAKSSHARR